MKRKFLTGLVFGSMILCMAELAEATVINFADLSSSGTDFSYLGNTVTHDGFTFSSTPGMFGGELGIWQDSSPNHPTGGGLNTALVEYYAEALTTMTESNNHPFQLNAIDLASWGNEQQQGSFNVEFVGTKYDGSTVQQIFTMDSDGLTPVLKQFSFGHEFTDLVQVDFRQGIFPLYGTAYQFNNVVLSEQPTPEPASMLLLGTGLAALAGARKLKKQQAA
jgi:hypothetical protein